MPDAMRDFIVGNGFLVAFSLLVVVILVVNSYKNVKRIRKMAERGFRDVMPKEHRGN